jgi:hypothetical protein
VSKISGGGKEGVREEKGERGWGLRKVGGRQAGGGE